MSDVVLKLTDIAHGGLAIGREEHAGRERGGGRPVFVPFGIPGETVRARITRDGPKFAHAELLEVLEPAADRVAPSCRHFSICGNCHFQHIAYAAQPVLKRNVAADQLARVGNIRNPQVDETVPAPEAYGTLRATTLFPVEGGGLGYWSPVERRIFPVAECPILHPRLQEALTNLDVALPGLRKLTLRLGDDELLAALEVDDVEPPELQVDFPVSVAIVFPDNTAASLIGDPYLVLTIDGQPFRFSPGVAFPPSPAAAQQLIAATLAAADIRPGDAVMVIPGNAGWLAGALAKAGAELTIIEPNPDAVADMVANLEAFDNISLYEGYEEEVLPLLDATPDVMVLQPDGGLTEGMWYGLEQLRPRRAVVVSEIGLLAKDARRLGKLGYRLERARPVDARPQGYWVGVVAGFGQA